MAGYARGPFARVADERNRLTLPFDQTPPAPVTPGEVPDVAPPSGLSHIEAGPRANYMAEADAAMKLTP